MACRAKTIDELQIQNHWEIKLHGRIIVMEEPICTSSMASLEKVDPISAIHPDKETWKIRARVVRLWTIKSQFSAHLVTSIHMILLDVEGTKIQASITLKELVEKYLNQLVEGQSYKFQNFNVGHNNGEFRTTKHKYRINFNGATGVQPCEITTIPLYAFDFVPIADILQKKNDEGYLVDVIGALQSYGKLDEFQRDGTTNKRIIIELTDKSKQHIRCILFGDYAQAVHDHMIQSTESIVVVLQLARVKEFKGEIQIINSWSATKILFNPNIPEADEFMKSSCIGELTTQRFTQSTSQTASSGDGDFLTSTRRLTINQIKETNQTGIFVTLATILKIQTNFGWFYESCNKCMKKIRNQNGLLLCPSCNKTPAVIIPRFKIHVQVIDHTGNATFVLFDRQGYQLLQKTAKELRDQLTKDGQEYSFPEQLESIVAKMFAFKFEITDFNLSRNQSSYSVRSLTDDINIINELKKCPEFNEEFNAQEDDNDLGDCEELGRTSINEVASLISENETDICLMSNITPSKRASPDDVQTIGLTEMLTPQMSSTKPIKQIKKEKFD